MFYKLIKWRFISLLLLVPIYVYPQLQQTRFDTLISSELEAYEVLPAQTHGVILFRNFSSDNLHQVEITLLDTAFQNVWSGFTPLVKHRLITKIVKGNFLYLIFYKDEDKNFSIYQVNLISKEFLEYTITNTLGLASAVNVTSKGIIIGGEFSYTPFAIFFEFATGTTRVLTGFFYTRGSLLDIETHEDGSFDILGSAVLGKVQTIWVNSYSSSGSLNKNVLLSNDTKYDLVYEKAMVTSQNSLMVAGSYGHVWGMDQVWGRKFDNKGLFLAQLDNGIIKNIQYHRFRELACLPKLQGKNDAKKLAKGESFKIQALAEYQNQVLVLGEIFSENLITDYSFPTYESPKPVMEPLRIDSKSTKSFFHESINPPPPDINNNRYTVTDSYQITFATVLSFDNNNELRWVNNTGINIKRTSKNQTLKMLSSRDKIFLQYLNGDVLYAKSIQDGSTIFEEHTKLQVKNGENSREFLAPYQNKIYNWNDGFLVSGMQIIDSAMATGLLVKKVFFMNKVKFR